MSYHILHYDGNLVGVTPFEWVALQGVSVETVEGSVPDLNNVVWDSETLRLVPVEINNISKLDFMSRFTLEERISIRNSIDPVVIDTMELITAAENINTKDSRTIQAINYFSTVGLIQQNRIQELLA